MLVVHGAGHPSNILPKIYMAKLIASRRISFTICYITFQTRISFKEHTCFLGEFMLLLDVICVRYQAEIEGLSCNVFDKAFKSLPTL